MYKYTSEKYLNAQYGLKKLLAAREATVKREADSLAARQYKLVNKTNAAGSLPIGPQRDKLQSEVYAIKGVMIRAAHKSVAAKAKFEHSHEWYKRTLARLANNNGQYTHSLEPPATGRPYEQVE